MSIINRPHDRFFKETMGDVENASDFLVNYLPEDILQLIDMNGLTIQKETFIEKELQEAFSDVLYRTNIKDKEACLYFLFEHKSHLHKTTALQLLRYMVKIWDHKINKEKAHSLPIIIPLVIYHGKDEWKVRQNLMAIIDGGDNLPLALKRYIPDFEYILYDFSPLSEKEIKGGVILKIFLETIKAVFRNDPADFMKTVEKSFTAIEELQNRNKGIDYLETLIRYIMSARQDIEFAEVLDTAKNISAEGSEIIMTIAEKLINEGMEKGMEKGVLNAKTETATRQLTRKFGFLPEDMQHKIQKADAETLDFILDNIFDLTSLDDIFKCLDQ